jgi:hypothetical protein
METTESNIGYPEEQPREVGDETTERDRGRERGDGAGSTPETESGDGRATGNPRDSKPG